MSQDVQTIVRSAEWIIQQIVAGVLPDIIYYWMPGQFTDHLEAQDLVLVLWVDPVTQASFRIADMTGMLLVASRAQWQEAMQRRRPRRIFVGKVRRRPS